MHLSILEVTSRLFRAGHRRRRRHGQRRAFGVRPRASRAPLKWAAAPPLRPTGNVEQPARVGRADGGFKEHHPVVGGASQARNLVPATAVH
ncbi:hypothetical protein AB0D71_40605 [Streptomyces avermitilis]|uniref:hypothetical protein n=1 Tax=Streptomyces avermitilis TaxID=33903 RepID=UPI0033D2F862